MTHTQNTTPCARCGQPFPTQMNRGRPQRYCSLPCYWEHRFGMTLAERFRRLVKKTDGCWLWAGSHDANGYGVFELRQKRVLAHRAAWSLAHGPIPHGMDICHRCDNPGCVRPDHLFLGSHGDNMADMAKKLRVASAKLTPDAVREMRRSYVAGSVTMRALADAYGLCIATVYEILRCKTWRHVPDHCDELSTIRRKSAGKRASANSTDR